MQRKSNVEAQPGFSLVCSLLPQSFLSDLHLLHCLSAADAMVEGGSPRSSPCPTCVRYGLSCAQLALLLALLVLQPLLQAHLQIASTGSVQPVATFYGFAGSLLQTALVCNCGGLIGVSNRIPPYLGFAGR